jgi:hypothetical protein
LLIQLRSARNNATAVSCEILLSAVAAIVGLGACAEPPERVATGDCRPACTISTDTVWSSDPKNPDLSLTHSTIERGDSVLAVETYRNTYLVLLDRAGKTVRIAGRKGEGPGEYRSISMISQHDDGRVYVFDRRRLTILDTSLAVEFISTLPVVVEQGVVLPNRTAVVDGTRSVGDSMYSLHLLGADGKLVRSFGERGGKSFTVTIARGREGTVWVARRFEGAPVYEIQRWDPGTGQVLQTIRDDPPWFRWSPPEPTTDQRECDGGRGNAAACERAHDAPRPAHPVAPAISDIWESPDGLLWVVSLKADPRWKEAAPTDWDRRLNSVLEVRDAETGVLLGSREFDAQLTGFTNRGSVVMAALNDRDEPQITLLSVAVPTISK